MSTEWEEDETEVPGGGKPNLWEESWDDDDLSEDFSKQLKFVPHPPHFSTSIHPITNPEQKTQGRTEKSRCTKSRHRDATVATCASVGIQRHLRWTSA